MHKKLYRSTVNKMICGVCGGVSEYFDIDVSIVRVIWGALAFTGFGLAAYFIAALVVPAR
ncbi:MAG TPA: PspC domain-containing protein [Feifaniaceae bacterium]|nr:PspC domain-containing protein [Feifaniaceae bacterium]